MNRREILAVVGGTVGVAGCSDLTDSPGNSSAESTGGNSAGDDSVALTSQHRERFREHGWSENRIDCFENVGTEMGAYPSQPELNQAAEEKLEELNQIVASIARMTVDMRIKDDGGFKTIVAEHTFHGVELENTEFAPSVYVGELPAICPSVTPGNFEENIDAPEYITVELGSIKPSDVGSNGVVTRTSGYGSGPKTISYTPRITSKHTSKFENTLEYPEPELSIEVTNVNIEQAYSERIYADFTVRVQNTGGAPAIINVKQGSTPIAANKSLHVRDTLTETHSMYGDPGEEVNFTVNPATSSGQEETLAQTTYTLPDS
jgi:hypothetical protein